MENFDLYIISYNLCIPAGEAHVMVRGAVAQLDVLPIYRDIEI